MRIFGKYANFYDLLYQDKDYEGECDGLEEIFKKYAKLRISSILDLGCGTGNHAFLLHGRGYKIVGVDRSEVMLVNAERKLSKLPNKKNIRFEKGDIRKWKDDKKFDAVIMMFAVLGYQLTNRDVLQTLSTVNVHLKRGGLFIFDVWYGPSVIALKPSKRIKTVKANGDEIKRLAWSEIDKTKNMCIVHYITSYIKGKQQKQKIKEDHQMRYFFPAELSSFLEKSDLELIHLGAFPNWKEKPSKETWNIFGIARAV